MGVIVVLVKQHNLFVLDRKTLAQFSSRSHTNRSLWKIVRLCTA